MGKTEKNRADSKNINDQPIETQPKPDKYKTEKNSTDFISTGNDFQYGLFECDKNENALKALLLSALCPCCTAGYIAEYIGNASFERLACCLFLWRKLWTKNDSKKANPVCKRLVFHYSCRVYFVVFVPGLDDMLWFQFIFYTVLSSARRLRTLFRRHRGISGTGCLDCSGWVFISMFYINYLLKAQCLHWKSQKSDFLLYSMCTHANVPWNVSFSTEIKFMNQN